MAYEIELTTPDSNPDLLPATTRVAPTEMGPNPYFPDDELPPEQDASADPGQAVVEDGQDPEPTFDTAADEAAGIDVNSPNYKHFQAAYTRKMQAAKERDLGAELDALRSQQQKRQIAEGTTDAPVPESQAYEIKWEGFRPGMLPPENPLSGTEADISTLVRQHVEYAVAQVNRQNETYIQQTKLAQTRDYLTQVVDEIGNYAGPAKKQEALNLLEEHIGVAKADPVKWARFAVNYLGIQIEQPASGPATTAPAPAHPGNAAKTVQQIRGQATRPSAGSNSAPREKAFTGPNATANAIAHALDQQLRR